MQSVELVLKQPVAKDDRKNDRVPSVSNTTEHIEKLNCYFFCRVPILAGLITTLIILASGCFMLYVYIAINTSEINRQACVFSVFIIIYMLSLLYKNALYFSKGFRGKIDAKPFERKVPSGQIFYIIPAHLFYEVWSSNGKYYLWRLFGTEVVESLYQIFNFGLYACMMSSHYLLLYSIIMAR